MKTFTLKSRTSDLQLELSDISGDYFTAKIISENVAGTLKVYAYTDSQDFADMFEEMAARRPPWHDIRVYQSLEGEFRVSSECSSLGVITFEIGLNQQTHSDGENWKLIVQIESEIGLLPELARSARSFFGPSHY